MSNIRLACETYTWQMPGEQYKGRLEHILDVCANAGFEGIEPEASFLKHLSDPVLMKEQLDKYHLELAAFCIVADWKHPTGTDEERKMADGWINFLMHFPDTILLTVQMPGADRSELRTRQDNMIKCVNDISRRAAAKGLTCSHHPNSPSGSVFRIASDYEVLMEGLDWQATGYCPDVGHLAKGGMDPGQIIRQHRDLINLVHYKDIDPEGNWAETGKGVINFGEITEYLVETGFRGWIVMEDECDEAIEQPDQLTMKDGIYIKENILPILSGK